MPAASTPRSIALVGMMGAGKTSVGRLVAARLRRPFYDSDAQVEQAAGCTVSEIFNREGEAAFRERERAAIATLLAHGPIVLAAGGGAMADSRTRTLLLERAETVWLDADPAVLARRLANPGHRPLLQGVDREEALARLLEERRPFYGLSAHHVRTRGESPEQVADALMKLLSG